MPHASAGYTHYQYRRQQRAIARATAGGDRRIIGVQEPSLIHKTTDDDTGDLTQTTTFGEGDWALIKADSARVELVNNTGASRTLTDCVIRARPVIQVSGESGLIHDAHEDFEDIVKNGEKLFEFESECIVRKNQLEQLADYYWKYNKTKKHVYVVQFPGCWYWLTPGDWYKLEIGGAGESEYIDSFVECSWVKTTRKPR